MDDDENRRTGLDRLPFPYAEALRLRDAGVTNRVIADIVGIEPESVDLLMQIAEAKLAAVEHSGDGSEPSSAPGAIC